MTEKFKGSEVESHTSLLFITLTDKVARAAREQYKGTPFVYRKLQPVYVDELLHGDDVMLFANSKEENKIEVWATALQQHGLH